MLASCGPPAAAPCTIDADCGDGRCVDGFCTAATSPVDGGVEVPVRDDGGARVDAGRVFDGGAGDAGTIDAGVVDPGPADAGVADAGFVDAGTVDAGSADAGFADAGFVDAGTVDAGFADAGTVDAGFADAGFVDAGFVLDPPWAIAAATQRRKLVVDGTVVDEDYDDRTFPVLVVLPSTFLPGTDGDDVRFVDGAGVQLPFDVEGWTTGEVDEASSYVWVGVRDLGVDEVRRTFWLYSHADAALPPTPPTTDVWTAYAAVWHMTGLEESASFFDATCANDAAGIDAGTCPTLAADGERAGRALSFAPGAHHYQGAGVATAAPFHVDPGEQITASTWFLLKAAARRQYILSTAGACRGWMVRLAPDGGVEAGFDTSTGGCESGATVTAARLQTATRFDDDEWHHVAVSIDRFTGQMRLLVDAVEIGAVGIPTTGDGAGFTLQIGSSFNDAQHVLGMLDEVRVAPRVESTAEVRTHVAAMRGALVDVGDAHDRDGAPVQ